MPSRPLTADPPTPDALVLGGPRIIDRYQVVAVIGRGATGAVYRALDTRTGRTVALKTASGSRDGARLTDRVRQRFLREATALSKVDQRNVVQVLDFGFADDGTPFLVMEHLRGRDLAAELALAERPLPVAEVADVGMGVCAALRACHRVGIIHRDLKAANVFLVDTDTGIEIKVLDFGVCTAAAADDRTCQVKLTAASHHLAPEQIDGKVGPASDQYALGVLLHLCLTRQPPQRLRAARTSGATGLPPALDAILRRATRIAPAERFESVYALGRELLEFASPRAQVQWRAYYRPPAELSRASSVAVEARNAGRPGTRTTSVDAARVVTSTKVSRRPGGDARAGGARVGAWPRLTAPWPLRAAGIGCVALAATGLATGRRRPPRPAPVIAAARRNVTSAAATAPRHNPAARPNPEPHPPVEAAVFAPLPPEPTFAPVVPPRRRAKPQPDSPPPLPNIDSAGVGIPTE